MIWARLGRILRLLFERSIKGKTVKEHPDFLRSPESVCRADPRQDGFAVLAENGPRPKQLKDQFDDVAELALHSGVPRGIRVQFETAKNLYLYSWFVYRFYPVARSHAYACLELALRERFGDDISQEGRKRHKGRRGLRSLLKYAIENDFLKNKNFSVWKRRTALNARMRILSKAMNEMKTSGTDRLEYDDSDIQIEDVDRDHDYVGALLDSIPDIRNHFAHGSESLDSHVLGTLQQVMEIINQVFSETERDCEATTR